MAAGIIASVIFFYNLTFTANAQVPSDFDINCQRCPISNNDVLSCNNMMSAPYVDFTWTQSSGATRYEIFYKNSSIGAWSAAPVATITNLSNLRYSANVPLDSQNHYYIKAINGNSGEYKSCSISYIPNRGGGCKAANTNYQSSDEGAEANCVRPAPSPATCSTSFTPASITSGGWTTQTWASTNDADNALQYSCTGNIGSGALPVSGSRIVTPAGTQTCTFTATNTTGAAVTCSATITVNPAPPPPPPPPVGPPPPPADIVPPVISNVRVINITTTSASVLWDTDELSDSQVEYCPGFSKCGTNTPLDSQMVRNHTVNLSGLTPGTVYAVWVKSRDAAGNLGVDGYYPFTTKTSPPPPPPGPSFQPPTSPPPLVISNIQISNIGYRSVTVNWTTDRDANGIIIACTSTYFCSYAWAYDANYTINHQLSLSPLNSDTQYNIWIFSRDRAGIRGRAISQPFKTLAGLTISNINATATRTSIMVDWNTNYPADSWLLVCRYSLWVCFGARSIFDPAFISNHSMNVSGLNPNTTYYYYVFSKDPYGFRLYKTGSIATPP